MSCVDEMEKLSRNGPVLGSIWNRLFELSDETGKAEDAMRFAHLARGVSETVSERVCIMMTRW